MQIDQIPLDRLSIAAINMRRGRKRPAIDDILPSVQARGVLSPLFVRPNGKPDHFEIIAGKRRYYASLEAARTEGTSRTLPCIVLGPGDDAEALEISMIENLLREDPDEVTQWESFTRLVKQGRSVEDIAATFALGELKVKRILALGDLLPPIREAYRSGAIDAPTVRHLTLASRERQRDWLALFEDADAHAPRGGQLKGWLFGGSSIATSVALFDLAAYAGQVVADLFGEDGYFADSECFWQAQMAAVEARKADYLAQGWADAVVIPPLEHFAGWEHERVSRRKGGKVYIQLRRNGEVVFHEGFLPRRDVLAAERRARGEEERPARAELTAALVAYVDLHRHAAVGAALAGAPGLALRVVLAHALAGSPLWHVQAADTQIRNEATAASLAASPATRALAEHRSAAQALLGIEGGAEPLCQQRQRPDLAALLHRLIGLDDQGVLQLLALVMAETLGIGSEAVEYLGEHLAIDMAANWQADEAFFGLLRDKEVMVAILAETGGEAVATANAREKGSALKRLIADHLAGDNGRPRIEGWVPRWMTFPPAAYTARGGVPTVAAAKRARWQVEGDEEVRQAREPVPQPLPPGETGGEDRATSS